MKTAQSTAQSEKATDLLADLRQAVGAEFVVSDARSLARAARTTAPQGTSPAVIVRPASTLEVREVVRCAARHARSIYPISGGKNWGYGDACAPKDGCLLLDLSRMNRILEVNTELAYAVVEPGVTQGQLFNYLREHRIPLRMDAIGAGPEASILGNIMDRGVGLSPNSDRYATSCAMEVVLPDGRMLRTGFGAYPEAQAKHLYKHGCGPALDGLFTQSNLGIVTRLTIWLMPEPEQFEAFFIRLRDPEAIGALTEGLRRLRLAGTLRCSVHCFNALRILGGLTRFPWDRADGKQALEVQDPKLCRELLNHFQVPAWLATGSLAGSPAEVAAARRALRNALRSVPGVKLDIIDRRKLGVIRFLQRRLPAWNWLQRFRARLEKVEMWVEFLQGKPSFKTLCGAHWRARGQAGSTGDPLDSGSGLIWVSPVLPMTAPAVAEVSRIGQSFFHQFGFEYQVTFSQVSDRALCAILSIHFDRSNPEETARASACHDAMLKELLQRGYVPYRGAPQTMEFLHQAAPGYWELTRKLKSAFDPQEVIAPGRYIPKE